jgi:glycosyltransferase involved in cell wall biosynthesis
MTRPLISVVMPVYNAERYVAQAVESILAQTLADFELLVFDDGSTDRSLEILLAHAERDNRMTVLRRPHRGYVALLNEGIQISRGNYIARMDADDVSLPDRFESQARYMEEDRDCVVLGSNVLVINSCDEPLGVLHQETNPKTIQSLLLNGVNGVIIHPASLMRRETVVTVGGYREQFESIEDLDLWLRLAEKGQLTNLPQILFKYRLNPLGVTAINFRRQERHIESIINEARRRRGLQPRPQRFQPPFHASDDEVAHLQLQSIFIAGIGNRKRAIEYAFLALSKEPLSFCCWKTLCWVLLPRVIKFRIKQMLFACES